MDAMNLGASKNKVPVDVKFGESTLPMVCSGCQSMNKYGCWIVVAQEPTLICVKCVASAVVKMQDLYPDMTLFDVDINVDPGELAPSVKAVRELLPELTDAKAYEVAKAALYAIG